MRLIDKYRAVRATTLALAEPLSVEDQMLQSMPDASPTKWHLAHTSWFFEEFVLGAGAGPGPGTGANGPRPFDDQYGFLFNSYYEAVGQRLERSRRGMLSRPALTDVHRYRRHVDEAVTRLLEAGTTSETHLAIIELGLHHEQQHQELLLTDIKHAFGSSPQKPAYRADPGLEPAADRQAGMGEGERPIRFLGFDEGIAWIGHEGPGFSFDNEGPRHRCFLRAFVIADRPITCGEYLMFMRDGGYDRPDLWLSDGWQHRMRESWRAPLYWEEHNGIWTAYTLAGMRAVDPREPVSHVSYFEADAFARWSGARLPTEEEWERAATSAPLDEHFADVGRFHPRPARAGFFGDVWQWTQSPYVPYPGYRAPAGALGEYNGKFMCNQMVLRGGSCLTPAGHVRATYRNFFPPAARWQASGILLAKDA